MEQRALLSLPSTLEASPFKLQIRSEEHRLEVNSLLREDDQVARWTRVPHPYTNESFDAWLGLDEPHYVILQGEELLGSVGASVDSDSRSAEVGFWLSKAGRGRGAATLALKSLCEALFKAGYERLFADVLVGNSQSEQVLRRAGFRFEGRMRSIYAPRCGLNEERRDQLRFSRLPNDTLPLHGKERPLVMNLEEALASFSELWSPRVVERVNDYEVRVAKVQGEHLWHSHVDTDEVFLVLSGSFGISLRVAGNEREVLLQEGELFVVPRGVQHRPHSKDGASILMFEREGTLSVGDYEGSVPDHIDSTRGHSL